MTSLFNNQNQEKKYCDSCREVLFTPAETWEIDLNYPGSGGLGLFKKGQKYKLCKKCFLDCAELLELRIIKRGNPK